MTREEAHKLIDQLFDKQPVSTEHNGASVIGFVPPEAQVAEAPAKVLPEGKRVVRTKTSGDRVYLLDDVKKSRQWVTNPDVLVGTGFDMSDVVEVEDTELIKYSMGPALFKAPSE